jgi:hypothetical protein
MHVVCQWHTRKATIEPPPLTSKTNHRSTTFSSRRRRRRGRRRRRIIIAHQHQERRQRPPSITSLVEICAMNASNGLLRRAASKILSTCTFIAPYRAKYVTNAGVSIRTILRPAAATATTTTTTVNNTTRSNRSGPIESTTPWDAIWAYHS